MDVIHDCLNVIHIEAAVDFYTGELSVEESWSFESADGRTDNRYVADGNGLELQLSETEGVTDLDHGSAWDHLAIVVDVDGAFDRIDHFGVVEEPSDQPEAGARTAFVEHRHGHHVELVEPLE